MQMVRRSSLRGLYRKTFGKLSPQVVRWQCGCALRNARPEPRHSRGQPGTSTLSKQALDVGDAFCSSPSAQSLDTLSGSPTSDQEPHQSPLDPCLNSLTTLLGSSDILEWTSNEPKVGTSPATWGPAWQISPDKHCVGVGVF